VFGWDWGNPPTRLLGMRFQCLSGMVSLLHDALLPVRPTGIAAMFKRMMNRMATSTQLTWEEFERLPDQAGKQELLKGELIELPPAKDRHHNISESIRDLLKAAIEEAHARGQALDLGRAHQEKGYRLGYRNWLQPDVSVTHAGQTAGDYMEGAPAIAIEVVSPNNTPRALAIKTALYFEFGALEVWHFYPDEDRRVVVYVAGAEPVTVRDFVKTALLPGFVLDVQDTLRA
jgi:Uma2 family endonuclease